MADREIGFIELTVTTRIIFSVGSWKGQSRGSIRKFVATEKYAGPTKSGMSLDGPTLLQLLATIHTVRASVPSSDPNQFISVGKTREWEIRVAVIQPDKESKLPTLDIREFVETPGYTGPTKKGVRLPWDKLKQFSQILEVMIHQLGLAISSEVTLFPEVQQKWLSDAKETIGTSQQKSAAHGLDAKSLKAFPDGFLPAGKLDVDTFKLPDERLKINQDRDGHYSVTDDSTFLRQVRNEVEGKYLVYAQQRGVTELRLPKEMFKVFSAVANYEKYCRELRQKLIRDFEVRSGNRTLAEHMATETMQSQGLPLC